MKKPRQELQIMQYAITNKGWSVLDVEKPFSYDGEIYVIGQRVEDDL